MPDPLKEERSSSLAHCLASTVGEILSNQNATRHGIDTAVFPSVISGITDTLKPNIDSLLQKWVLSSRLLDLIWVALKLSMMGRKQVRWYVARNAKLDDRLLKKCIWERNGHIFMHKMHYTLECLVLRGQMNLRRTVEVAVPAKRGGKVCGQYEGQIKICCFNGFTLTVTKWKEVEAPFVV